MKKIRMKAPRRKDKKIFARTAKRTKAINLGQVSNRGGVRL